jgi:GAF domain-containing protein
MEREMVGMASRERQVVRAVVALADTLVDERGGLQLLASSTEQARLLELFQLDIDEGPCIECFTTSTPVLVSDIAAQAARWPRFAAEAAKDGFASVHAVPLRLRKQTIGALNLFGLNSGDLSADDVALAQGLADTATIGILHERAFRREEILSEQLQTALNSRVIIEQAKGVLAVSGQLSMDEAFRALRGFARGNNLRLSDVARALADRDLAPAVVLAPSATRHSH